MFSMENTFRKTLHSNSCSWKKFNICCIVLLVFLFSKLGLLTNMFFFGQWSFWLTVMGVQTVNGNIKYRSKMRKFKQLNWNGLWDNSQFWNPWKILRLMVLDQKNDCYFQNPAQTFFLYHFPKNLILSEKKSPEADSPISAFHLALRDGSPVWTQYAVR